MMAEPLMRLYVPQELEFKRGVLSRDSMSLVHPVTPTHVPRQPLYLDHAHLNLFCFFVEHLDSLRVNVLSTVNS